MEKAGRVSVKADVTYLISMALKKELSWNALLLVLDSITWTNEQCKTVVKLLLKEIEILKGQLELKENQASEIEYPNESIIDSQLSESSIQKPQFETEDILDLSEDRIITCDSRDYESDLQHVDYEAIALENQFNKVIDNEYYTFVGETNTAVRSDNEDVQSQPEPLQENDSYFENEANENVIVSKIVKDRAINETAKINLVKEQDNNRKIYDTNDKERDSEIESENEDMTIKEAEKISSFLKSDVRIHTGDVPFECKICNRRFKSNLDLNKHERVHTGEMPFECKTCKKRFNRSNSLKKHERIHTGEVPYECKTCKKRFKQSSTWKRHEMIHSGAVPHECKTCNKRFKRKEQVKIHERIHTGEVPYECKTCKKRFNQSSVLKRHERIHTEEMPYECKTCNKRFKINQHLMIHERIHTGEVPYECKTCKKRFNHSSVLKRHDKVHTGEKSFKCKSCSKSFARKDNLRIHYSCHSVFQ